MTDHRSADPRAECRGILRDFARTFEAGNPCWCDDGADPITATGHRHSCPVDAAVRFDLAKAGIV